MKSAVLPGFQSRETEHKSDLIGLENEIEEEHLLCRLWQGEGVLRNLQPHLKGCYRPSGINIAKRINSG